MIVFVTILVFNRYECISSFMRVCGHLIGGSMLFLLRGGNG
jgi:hypothetical protein